MPALNRQINEYSKTKLQGETVCQSYEGPLTILRPRAVFGPRDTVLLPRILDAAAKKRLPHLTRRDNSRAVGDLIYIDSLVSYISKAVEERITGSFNLTNNEPVPITAFVDDILQRLGYPLPTKNIPVDIALLLARILETFSRVFLKYREPPITRFGISVFAYSKTFDTRRTLAHFGVPKVTVAQGVEALVQWWMTEGKRP